MEDNTFNLASGMSNFVVEHSGVNNNLLGLNSFELNTDNTDLGISMTDTDNAIEIDEDISHSILVQDVYMGR